LTVYNNDLYVGGHFTQAGGQNIPKIARWNGNAWSAVGSGLNNAVLALSTYSNFLIAGGTFTQAGGISANRIARWNGNQWSAFCSGVNSEVDALVVYNGNLIAGGLFTQAGGITANYIAGYDGTRWYALPSQPPIAEAGGPYQGVVNTPIRFDASNSYDTDGVITGYRWDWTNDGIYDTDWLTNPITTHSYPSIQAYTAKLQVKDNCNVVSEDTADVTVLPAPLTVYVDSDYLTNPPQGYGYDHFATIAEGITAVAVGGSVYVYEGTYYEYNLAITKSMVLNGENQTTTIIDFSQSQYCDGIRIGSDHVTVTGFTLRNNRYDSAIDLSGSYCCIAYNTFINDSTGILCWCQGGVWNYITRNTFTRCGTGVNPICENIQIPLIIDENVFLANSVGVGTPDWARNVQIRHNVFQGNTYAGIHVRGNEWIITDNTFEEGNAVGVGIDGTGFGDDSYNNHVYHNNFRGNVMNAQDNGCNGPYLQNFWDAGPSLGGNYWDDWNHQGSYSIPGYSGSVDHYPFGQMNGWFGNGHGHAKLYCEQI
jgi:hypothetical protein